MGQGSDPLIDADRVLRHVGDSKLPWTPTRNTFSLRGGSRLDSHLDNMNMGEGGGGGSAICFEIPVHPYSKHLTLSSLNVREDSWIPLRIIIDLNQLK